MGEGSPKGYGHGRRGRVYGLEFRVKGCCESSF